MTLLEIVSSANLPKSRRRRHLPGASLAVLIFLFTVCFSPAYLGAQESPAGPRGSQVQTAARARNVGNPAAQWSAGVAENGASTQPRVTFENGLLSISANNSSLSDILVAVHSCTGADIDLPNTVSAERVTAQLGPGPARKVLSDLLGWSNYDYIIQGSDTDSLAVQSVTLMVRTKSTTAPVTPTAGMVNGRQSTSPIRPVPEMIPTPTPRETSEASSAPETSAPPSDGFGMTPETQAQPMAAAPSPGSTSGKSTAEMIQELQQMYQQRRVMQQQQGQNPGQKPPSAN